MPHNSIRISSIILIIIFDLFAFPRTAQSSSDNVTVTNAATQRNKKPVLIVVSYDGFRNEYLTRDVTPNLLKFQQDGIYADYTNNVFPTKTFTNHHSIATGFYPDKHGVLANSLYDQTDGELHYSWKLFHYNASILPIWVVNQLEGGYSGCMMWPGSNFEYRGVQCTYVEKYNPKMPLEERINIIMKWITNPDQPANLVMFYSEQPDKIAHVEGPDSEKVTEMIAKLDLVTKYLQDQIVAFGLEDRAHVVHLSDHGMGAVSPSNLINLTNYLEDGTYKMYGNSPVLQVVPEAGYFEDVYERLKNGSEMNGHFDVYKTEDMPARWHAANPKRFGPIVVVAKVNYSFQDLWPFVEPTTKYLGVHGYDNNELQMKSMFMAKGPEIKSSVRIKSFETVDLFFLFTQILGIEDVLPRRDGSYMRAHHILERSRQITHKITTVAIIIVCIVIIGIIICTVNYFKKRKQSYNAA